MLGHRLSEWCGHGPILEEDIALSNIALDLIGHASALLALAGDVEGKGRDEDALAYFRDGVEFRNALMVELPNGDFGFTMVRQFLFDAYSVLLLDALSRAGDPRSRRDRRQVPQGRQVSFAAQQRVGRATRRRYRRESCTGTGAHSMNSGGTPANCLITMPSMTRWLHSVSPLITNAMRALWHAMVTDVLARATLDIPDDGPMRRGGRHGRHTEHLGHMLSEMQIVARSHPGASW